MNTEPHESTFYVFLVQCTEVVYRRAKRSGGARLKIIRCPHCGNPLTAVDITTRVELRQYTQKADALCHEYRKCDVCNETVGMNFILG